MKYKNSKHLFSPIEDECSRIGKAKMAKGVAIITMTRSEFRNALANKFWTDFNPKDVDYQRIRMSSAEFVRSILLKVKFTGQGRVVVEFVKP